MRKSLLLVLALLMGLTMSFQSIAQERTVQGKVTSDEDGSPLPGVNVVIKGTTVGTITNADGDYRLAVTGDDAILVFSFVGYQNQEIAVGSQSVINVTMTLDVTQLSEVVVTALGVSREKKTLPYASQEVKSADLNITQNHDIKGALSGKVAGIQLNGQAGSKLGQFGKIRVRGAISLTTDGEPLYIVDGVPTPNPNDVDMNNVESVNVLKGPNATALYGQRAEFGVVVITTKKADQKGIGIDFQSGTTWEAISNLPNYQNEYGGGYEGDASFGTFDFNGGAGPYGPYLSNWSSLDGVRYLLYDNNYADESWGPKFDGQPYAPWYSWWPDSPYFGKEVPYSAQPDNVKNFYNTGVSTKNTVSVSTAQNNFTARLSYSNLHQKGITPYTYYNKNWVLANTEFNPVQKLKISTNIRYSSDRTKGDFNDGYGNQTSGSFNSWFNRNLETDKLYELRNLTTPSGISASWNWWGPDYYTIGGGFEKPAFWFNHYTFMENYKQIRNEENLAANISAAYNITDDLKVTLGASRNSTEYKLDWEFPFVLANSAAPELYNSWSNSFGKYRRATSENNYTADIRYNKKFEKFDISALVGGNIRKENYKNLSAQMPAGAKTGGLIIPDVFLYSNAGIVPVPTFFEFQKQVNSLYGNISLGYNGMLYLDASFRRDWSSALPASNNGYGYPSIGLSFIFSELMPSFNALSYGKVRAGWAQVGSDVGALAITSTYGTASQPTGSGKVLQYTPQQLVDPNITPALNSSIEAGFDTRWVQSRIGLSFTYYDEKHTDDILPISVSRGTGYNSYLTNAGEVRRRGIEIALDADVLKMSNGFTWNILFNFAKNKTTVEKLPGDLETITGPGGTGTFSFISVIQKLGTEWGQLRGTMIARDDNGNPIIQSSGLYKTVKNQYFGSVLPDFQGGIINRFTYKGIELVASIDYQKGGKFFSLSEMWGSYSGLTDETAAINDKGMNVRDAVGDGGGVHVTGVDANGAAVDTYVDALDYYKQWYSNRLAEPFTHDASYMKLREVILSYDLTNVLHIGFVKGFRIGVVGRNLALISVAKDNTERWDPSVLSQTYGENGQLPGTRSYGVNIQLTF